MDASLYTVFTSNDEGYTTLVPVQFLCKREKRMAKWGYEQCPMRLRDKLFSAFSSLRIGYFDGGLRTFWHSLLCVKYVQSWLCYLAVAASKRSHHDVRVFVLCFAIGMHVASCRFCQCKLYHDKCTLVFGRCFTALYSSRCFSFPYIFLNFFVRAVLARHVALLFFLYNASEPDIFVTNAFE